MGEWIEGAVEAESDRVSGPRGSQLPVIAPSLPPPRRYILMNNKHIPLLAASAAILASGAFAQDGSIDPTHVSPRPANDFVAAGSQVSVIYTNVVGHPANNVPGTGGLPFFFSATGTTVFVRPNVALDGQWVIEVDIDSGGTTDDNAYIRNGELVLREGDSTAFAAGETWGTCDDNVGINSTGAILLTNNLNGSAATTADDVVVMIDAAGNQTLIAREGDLVDAILPALAGATWDDSMDGPILTEVGQMGWIADGLDGTPGGTADDDVGLLGGAVLYQRGVVPAGQAGGATETWENFDFQDFHVSLDGSVTMMQGDLTGATTDDDVLAVNGVIVLQENQPIPGSGFVEPIDASGIVESWMDPVGNWFARGDNDVTNQDWVVRNGVVVAATQATMEIFPGAGEHWDDSAFSAGFFAFDGNSSGSYMIGGVTDAAADRDGVLVVYPAAGSAYVALREGDPVDMDGNGLFDDDTFIRTMGNDDCLLLEDGSILATVTLRDSLLAAKGSAFVRVGAPSASCTSDNGSGVNDPALSCATDPRLGSVWTLDIGLAPTTSATAAFLSFAPSAPVVVPFFAPYELLIDLSFTLQLPAAAPGTHNVTLPRPSETFWVERPVYIQGFRIDAPGGSPTLVMTNRIDAILGY